MEWGVVVGGGVGIVILKDLYSAFMTQRHTYIACAGVDIHVLQNVSSNFSTKKLRNNI